LYFFTAGQVFFDFTELHTDFSLKHFKVLPNPWAHRDISAFWPVFTNNMGTENKKN
jgi:hypothetical protein